MILNKKGDEEEGLIGNTLGTVLGITGTIIIVIFVYLVITRVWSDPATDSAKQIADVLEAKIKALEPGQSTKAIIQSSAKLDGWSLVGWSKNSGDRPDKCFFSSCFCICKGENAQDCQTKGICRNVEIDQIKVVRLEDETKTTGHYEVGADGKAWIPEKTETITVEKNTIPLPQNIMILNITKNETLATISYPKQ